MSTEKSHGKGFWNAGKILFLSLYKSLQTFSMAYFLHNDKVMLLQSSSFSQNLSMAYLTHWEKDNLEVPSMVLRDPQDLAPSTLFTNCTRHMKKAPATGPSCILSSALNALFPFVIMTHSLTSFRSLCKCLPFRDACPSQLSA